MNMKMASILCLVIMLAGCVAGQQRGLVGDTYVSSSQPALALKARDLPLMGSMTGASRLTSSGAMGGLLVDSWVTVYGKGDGASPLAIVAHGEVPNGWYWDGIMRHPFSINEGVETIGGVGFQACTYVTSEKRDAFLPLEDPEGARILAQDGQPPRRWRACSPTASISTVTRSYWNTVSPCPRTSPPSRPCLWGAPTISPHSSSVPVKPSWSRPRLSLLQASCRSATSAHCSGVTWMKRSGERSLPMTVWTGVNPSWRKIYDFAFRLC